MNDRLWARAVVWVSAILLGSLGLIVLVYSALAGVSLVYGFLAIGLSVAAFLFMVLVLVRFERSPGTGNTRWSDRERRGF